LAALIRQRQVSSLDVVEAHLAQIDQHNPTLNAIATLDGEGARRQARVADAALARGDVWGVLHGVPITLEDCHATAGLRSTWGGFPPLATHVPVEDGAVAARLKAAGAILLGKTHGPMIWGENSVFSRTNNPWDVERTPGGSSSGPAAALAAGLTPLDIGLDTLGSIQNPAHFCGICGMRPTENRVSLAGAFFIDAVRKFRVMSVTGPMARSIADLQVALKIIIGPDYRDPAAPPLQWRENSAPALQQLRIAWTSTFPAIPIAAEIRTAIEHLAKELEQLGTQVEQYLPEINFARHVQLGEHLFGLIANALEPRPEGTPPIAIDDYFLALHERDAIIAVWEQFFAEWDVLLCPVSVATASLHTDTVSMVDGEAVPDEQIPLLAIPHLLSPITGCPTVVIPLGKDQNGLPFGVQVMGRRWDDERVLAIAALLESLTGGFKRPPGY
jgi:amidase